MYCRAGGKNAPGSPDYVYCRRDRDARRNAAVVRADKKQHDLGEYMLNHPTRDHQEAAMNEDVFNGSLRRFLKKVGITSQREIEKAVRDARRRRPAERPRKAAGENRADRRRRQPLPRDHRRDRTGVGDLPWMIMGMGVVSLAICAAELGQ